MFVEDWALEIGAAQHVNRAADSSTVRSSRPGARDNDFFDRFSRTAFCLGAWLLLGHGRVDGNRSMAAAARSDNAFIFDLPKLAVGMHIST